MRFPIEKFHNLRERASETMQEPESWRVDSSANAEIIMNARFGEFQGSLDPETPMKLLGIDVVIDESLPLNRVALVSEQNTIGAFTIGEDDKEGGK